MTMTGVDEALRERPRGIRPAIPRLLGDERLARMAADGDERAFAAIYRRFGQELHRYCTAILGNADAIRTYWRLKTNVDSGLFEAVQLAGAAALSGSRKAVEETNEVYSRRRDLVVETLREIGVEVQPPKGTIYVWAPVPEGHTSVSFAELVLEEAAVVVSPGSMYGPSGEGFFRISLTTPDERLTEGLERIRQHLS